MSEEPFRPNAARGQVCGVDVAAASLHQAAQEIVAAAVERRSLEVHLCNAYTFSLIDRDPRLREALRSADLNLPDGTPIAWLLRNVGATGPVRGPGLMRAVAVAGTDKGLRHYLWGGADGVADEVAARFRHLHPGIAVVGVESPPFREISDAEVCDLAGRLQEAGADIIWIGIGTPRQDYFVPRIGRHFRGPVVPVGAAFDFLAGRVEEAPHWIQGTGLEWVHRLTKDPKRLWRRYAIGNPRFVASAIRHRARAER